MSVINNEPWSKKHKRVFKGLPFSLSNSFAQPVSQKELTDLTLARGDHTLVDEYNNHSLVYTPNGGSLDLRTEIANLYDSDTITADNILVFAGGQVANETAARAIVGNGDGHHAITFMPGYQSVTQGPSFCAGCQEVTMISLRPDIDWAIDVAEVRAAIRPNTRYICINEPYNPAGTLSSPETQAQLVKLACEHSIYILCDEVYRLLEHEAADRLDPMCVIYEKGISTGALSKPWGGCGITIGWLAFQDAVELKQRLLDVQYFGTACPSRASELQALMALRSSDAILNKNLTIIRRNLSLLDVFMDQYSDLFEWVRPKAGAICFIKFKGPLTSEELGDKLASKAGISIKPAYCFADGNALVATRDYFRVGFGEEIMPKALEVLIAFVEEQKDVWRDSL